jgi:uncharacterized protein YdeI (YjbR/CyaY-like superfamily)
MKITFFENTQDFRRWLKANGEKETELIVGYHKVSTGKPSMTWSESVDQALCFGWIDGIRRSVDEESYCIRFTPRKPNSNWSSVNIKKMEELIVSGQMTPAGLKLFELRKELKSEVYSYENRTETFLPEIEARFRQNGKAWEFFSKQAPSYRKTVIYWIMNSKQEATFEKRFAQLISECEEGKRLDLFTSKKKTNQISED